MNVSVSIQSSTHSNHVTVQAYWVGPQGLEHSYLLEWAPLDGIYDESDPVVLLRAAYAKIGQVLAARSSPKGQITAV